MRNQGLEKMHSDKMWAESATKITLKITPQFILPSPYQA